MPISGDGFSRRYSVVAETRRRWSAEEKRGIVAEAAQPCANVSAVARRHGIKPSLLFRWRRIKGRRRPPGQRSSRFPWRRQLRTALRQAKIAVQVGRAVLSRVPRRLRKSKA